MIIVIISWLLGPCWRGSGGHWIQLHIFTMDQSLSFFQRWIVMSNLCYGHHFIYFHFHVLPPQSKHQVTPWSPWLPQMRVVTSQIQGWTSMRLKSHSGKSSTFFRLKLVVGGTIFHRSDEECREIFSPMLRSLSLASQQGVGRVCVVWRCCWVRWVLVFFIIDICLKLVAW